MDSDTQGKSDWAESSTYYLGNKHNRNKVNESKKKKHALNKQQAYS